jgi:membrane protease YdiL (CAAX protease family)
VRLRRPLTATACHPAAWAFAGVWLGSAAVLVASGLVLLVLQQLGITLTALALSWLTAALTSPSPPPPSTRSWRLGMQVGALAVIAALTGVTGAYLGGVGREILGRLPGWSGLVRSLTLPPHFLRLPIPVPYVVLNPVTDVVLPLVVLLALGARPGELGLGRGHRVGRVLAIWAVLPLIAIGIALGLGAGSPALAAMVFLRNLFQNGFSEEFLWRGAIQTRLSRLTTPAWGLVLAALAFGLWHTGADASEVQGRVLDAACAGIVSQAGIGIGLGVVLQRTRNLMAGTVAHMLIDTIG